MSGNIVYHRRLLTEQAAVSRATCIDRFEVWMPTGGSKPVWMTRGRRARPIAPQGEYFNPVRNQSLPDPTIIRDDEVVLFYATESIRNVPILRSQKPGRLGVYRYGVYGLIRLTPEPKVAASGRPTSTGLR